MTQSTQQKFPGENLFTPGKIRTFSGKYIDPFNPDPEAITIEDIAHSLSQQPRFGGHLPEFYSVGQHSVICMMEAPTNLKLEALMHDASEAYLLDMPKPIKDRLPEYKKVEEGLMRVIAAKFGFRYPLDPVVKSIDEHVLEREWYNIMLERTGAILCQSPAAAKASFLRHFTAITRSK